MERPKYWNHNTAYYDWVRKNTVGCQDILDVGCGDGSLIRYLDDGQHNLTGIDVDEECITRASTRSNSANIKLIHGPFENYDFDRLFNAVIFVASIHHMDMTAALNKAKSLLKPGGVLLVVGLAKPSGPVDLMIEALRVIPCAVISKIRHMKSSENNNIPVSYRFPTMGDVRASARTLLPSSRIKYGLFYRYLLSWRKPS